MGRWERTVGQICYYNYCLFNSSKCNICFKAQCIIFYYKMGGLTSIILKQCWRSGKRRWLGENSCYVTVYYKTLIKSANTILSYRLKCVSKLYFEYKDGHNSTSCRLTSECCMDTNNI